MVLYSCIYHLLWCFCRSLLLRQESTWVNLMKILMVSFSLMYGHSSTCWWEFTPRSVFHALIIFIRIGSMLMRTSLFIFVGNGGIYKRTHPQFGTIARHAHPICSNVLPHSCTQVLFLLWSTQTRYKKTRFIVDLHPKQHYEINFLYHNVPFILAGKACIKKVLLSNCLQELMELHQVNFLILALFNVGTWLEYLYC